MMSNEKQKHTNDEAIETHSVHMLIAIRNEYKNKGFIPSWLRTSTKIVNK